ncbi:Com family DNA-binding transcriptional regulator [Chelonobacter oris]|uniref:Com family DNA-binding transcriptional regulator n=1 Tax=Chelonobacter oris TaxID=505317 RepID=UPI003CC52F85
MQSIKTIRCTFCNKLLAKVGTVVYLEIKCPRCKGLLALRTPVRLSLCRRLFGRR